VSIAEDIQTHTRHLKSPQPTSSVITVMQVKGRYFMAYDQMSQFVVPCQEQLIEIYEKK